MIKLTLPTLFAEYENTASLRSFIAEKPTLLLITAFVLKLRLKSAPQRKQKAWISNRAGPGLSQFPHPQTVVVYF